MKIYDISLPIYPGFVVWPGNPEVVFTLRNSTANGDIANVTDISLCTHTSTHMDAPRHFVHEAPTMEQVDLNIVYGPALVIDVGDVNEVTVDVLERADIPVGTVRLLIKSRNGKYWDGDLSIFHTDYVAIHEDAARWILAHGIKLIGIDYFSIAPFHDLVTTHRILLSAGVIALEAIDLRQVMPGVYTLAALPLKLIGSDGCPVRAILVEA